MLMQILCGVAAAAVGATLLDAFTPSSDLADLGGVNIDSGSGRWKS